MDIIAQNPSITTYSQSSILTTLGNLHLLNMAPSTTATTFEPIASVDTSKQSPQPPAKENGNGTLPVAEEPTLSQKNYHDTLAYEDKWIGWDGPVWCKRYGRFENKEQAAEDDGYKPVTHQSIYYSPFQSHLDLIAA